MERRVLVAVFLSFLVLYGYQALIGPPPPPPEELDPETGAPLVEPDTPAPTAEPLTPASSVTSSPPATAATSAAASTAPAGAAITEPAAVETLVGDTAERDVVVESEAFRAVFSNRGAVLRSWQLKHYLEDGVPVELVPRDLPEAEPWPFALLFDDPAVSQAAQAALFQPSRTEVSIDGGSESLRFEYSDASGLSLVKEFTFEPEASPYFVAVSVDARLGDTPLQPTLRWGPALGGVESTTSGFAFLQGPRGLLRGQVIQDGGVSELEVQRLDASTVTAQPIYEGQLDYAGVDNHYFIAVAVPALQDGVVRYRPVPLPPRTPEGDPRELMAYDLALAPGLTELRFFIGPKDFDILEAAHPTLRESIDFGWLSVLVVPLHRSLTWVHGWVGNWGGAIIVLTLLINIIILPLRHKSVVSMRKMQEIQPEMKAIQDRYAHLKATDPDKQKMNQEIMGLYRDRGVNPVSGCLPMLLTMPVLFAFYRLLSAAIELRGAPFVGWITDLSMHDPLYITPLVMGGSMVLQQRLQPMQGDPMQQRIMMMMPVVFTFMFLWAPAGLVVYWLTSNLIGIGQQIATNRIIGPPKVRTVRPPGEGRAKAALPPKPKSDGPTRPKAEGPARPKNERSSRKKGGRKGRRGDQSR